MSIPHAIGLRNGLLEELRDDFQWMTGADFGVHHVVFRLSRILRATQQRLTIFVDGWNEAERITQSLDLNQECTRLSHENITVVLSTTNISLPRLLKDSAGNSTYVADEASLKQSEIHLLARRGKQKMNGSVKDNVVEIGSYSSVEAKVAFSVYQHAYNVDASLWTQDPNNLSEALRSPTLSNPFLLSTAMRVYTNATLPRPLDEPALIRESLRLRAERAGYSEADLFSLLGRIGEGIFLSDAPLNQNDLQGLIGLPITQPLPSGLFDAAILTRTFDERGLPQLDFYYSRVRDYVLAFLTRQWDRTLLDANRGEAISEMSLAISREAVSDALRWFLTLPANIVHLRNMVEQQKTSSDVRVKETILSCISRWQGELTDEFLDWVSQVTDWAVSQTEPQVKEVAADLLVELSWRKPGAGLRRISTSTRTDGSENCCKVNIFMMET